MNIFDFTPKLLRLFFSALLLGMMGCIKPIEPTPQPPVTLPCDTCLPGIDSPKGTVFACRINSKPFIAKLGGGGFITTRFDYYEQNLSITGNNPDIKEACGFSLLPLIDTGLYNFPNSIFTVGNGAYFDWYGKFMFSSEPISKGYIHITQLDSIKMRISGTFAFDVYSKDYKDTIHITDGRFFMYK